MTRHEFLRRIHELVRPRNYLEIGVNNGRSLALSRVPSIAVDPAFKITVPQRVDVHLVKATSDDFFARPDPILHLRSGRNPLRNMRRGRPLFGHWLGRTTLDLAFIDGMHLFEFALRDFMNVERFSRWSTVIVLDDMLPRNIDEAAREIHTSDWTGDVFKVVPVLRRLRPDLIILLVDTEPTGVAVVLGADASSRTLHEHYEQVLESTIAADPQIVPGDVLDRVGAYDPEALLASPLWSTIRHARQGDRGRRAGIERIRAALDTVPS